jgi:hypothetical protein
MTSQISYKLAWVSMPRPSAPENKDRRSYFWHTCASQQVACPVLGAKDVCAVCSVKCAGLRKCLLA